MRKIRKIALQMGVLGATIAPIAVTIACSDDNDKPIIIVAVPSNSNNYNRAIVEFAIKEAEKRGFKVQELVTNEDTQKERKDILQVIQRGNVKGVVIAPAQSEASASLILELNKKGIPVVTFDRNIDSSTGAKLVGSIITDNVAAAAQLVKYAKDELSKTTTIKKIYVVNGEAGGSSAIERKRGFTEGIATHYAGITTTQVDTKGWSLNTAKEKFTTVASGLYSGISSKQLLILSAAIPMTNGVVGATGFNLTKSVVLGIDVDKSNLANINNDKIYAAGMQRPDIMAAWSIAKLNMIINKHTEKQEKEKYYTNTDFQEQAPLSSKDVKLPITIITKTNTKDVVY